MSQSKKSEFEMYSSMQVAKATLEYPTEVNSNDQLLRNCVENSVGWTLGRRRWWVCLKLHKLDWVSLTIEEFKKKNNIRLIAAPFWWILPY